MSAHTPGPWKISERDPQRDQFYIFTTDFTGDDHPIAIVTSHEDPDQHEADARLIAAAPALLEALQLICDSGCPLADVLTDKMIAALDKAHGQGSAVQS